MSDPCHTRVCACARAHTLSLSSLSLPQYNNDFDISDPQSQVDFIHYCEETTKKVKPVELTRQLFGVKECRCVLRDFRDQFVLPFVPNATWPLPKSAFYPAFTQWMTSPFVNPRSPISPYSGMVGFDDDKRVTFMTVKCNSSQLTPGQFRPFGQTQPIYEAWEDHIEGE